MLVSELLGQELPRLTEKTIGSREALLLELARVRKLGYGIDVDELEIGHSSVSTPIFNHRGEGIAAISISGPSARLNPKKLVELSERLKASSTLISYQLGYRSSKT